MIALIFGTAVTTHAQIPNPGFESWSAGDPTGWVTTNVVPAGLVNVTQTSDSHTGPSALQGEVVDFFSTPMAPVIQSGPGGTGFAITERYGSFDLWYKFTSVGGDKFSVNVALEKNGNPIAQGAVALPQTVTGFTQLSVPLAYTTGEVPDRAIIQLSITGPVTGSDVHTGSVMIIDDLLFSFATGITDKHAATLPGRIYPNPSSGSINLDIQQGIQEGTIAVTLYDLRGRQVFSQTIPAADQTVDLQLPDGVYVIKVQAGDLARRELLTIRNR